MGKPSKPQGKLVLIIGPSGVGKSVILKKLRLIHPQLHFPRSATTRPRRPGEGTELYHFVNDAEFDDLVKNHKLLEWTVVHDSAKYGTMIDEIIPAIEEGKTVVREIDAQGFENILHDKRFMGEDAPFHVESLFLLPESTEQLIKHIRNRAPISDDELAKRLKSMEREVKYAEMCDATVVNYENKLDDTIKEVEAFILKD